MTKADRELLWEEIRSLYEDTEMTLQEISSWVERRTCWALSLSAITNRSRRYGWQPRLTRCPIFPAAMVRTHLRDHYANALRAEAKVRRGERLSATEFEKWRQASSMIDEDLVLVYTPVDGFFPESRSPGMPADEWLSWWRDFDGEPLTRPLDAANRLLVRLLA
jgi:hypothetical protein